MALPERSGMTFQGVEGLVTGSSQPTWMQHVVGALNGVLGDYLVRRGNDLAVEIGFYRHGQRLELSPEALAQSEPEPSSRLVVFLHGSAATEGWWVFPDSDGASYGSLLQQDLGLTPFFVRFNSGLRISENGRAFADLVEQLATAYPREIEEIILIGHSMGGLIVRSACHYGQQAGHRWLPLARRAIFLGVPNLGAWLEKAANVASWVLRAVGHSTTRVISDVLNVRSAGIKDLRYSNLVDEDWQDADPDELLRNCRAYVPLTPGLEHYLIAGTLTEDPGHAITRMFGDTMVRIPSALGSERPWSPGFPRDHVAVFAGVSHSNLPRHPDIYPQIRRWCEPAGEDRNEPPNEPHRPEA